MIAQGTVDRDGRLIAADPRLLALQKNAGGEEGGVLAIPQLATLARLARTLGVLVSRGVVAAEGEDDLDLWVRAQIEGETVRLSVGGWTIREKPVPDSASLAERMLDFARLERDGKWSCDARARMTAMDEALLAALNIAPALVIGEPISRVFRFLETGQDELPLLEGMAARTAFAGQLAELKSAVDIRLTLYGEPRLDQSGQFSGYLGGFALEDSQLVTTARAQASAVDHESEDMAKRLDAALREPLKRIIANADDISMRVDGPLRQDYASYAGDISAAGRHLLGMVDDLADIRSFEQPDANIEMEPVDLADVARRAAGLLRVRAADKNVKIDAPHDEEIVMVLGDFRRILQILVNLLSNAVRYSPSGTSVWVRTEVEGDMAAIIVADQGKGVAVQDQDRIFAKFERVDSREPGGNGLGLYISRRLARAMGGDINIDSAPGMGARFTLTLRAATD